MTQSDIKRLAPIMADFLYKTRLKEGRDLKHPWRAVEIIDRWHRKHPGASPITNAAIERRLGELSSREHREGA